MRFEVKIEIAAPADAVFATYSDVERWPDWTTSVTNVELLEKGPLRVGSRARIRQPKLPTAVWEVTDLVPGRSFTWVAKAPGLRTTATHQVGEPAEDGQVTVTATLDQEGLLGGVVGRLWRSLTEQYLATELRGLKARSEG